jgi:hypothetical protein
MIGLKTKDKSRITIHNYPLLHKTYKHTLEFRNIYEETSRTHKEKNSELDRKTKLLEMTNTT